MCPLEFVRRMRRRRAPSGSLLSHPADPRMNRGFRSWIVSVDYFRVAFPYAYFCRYLHLSFDDIDQSKIKSPYNLQNTKECSGLLKLNNHCTGMLIHNGKFVNDRVVMAYLNTNQYPQVVLNLVGYSDVLIFSLQSNH